ncbi:S41 family peptidase [Candidatus Acetothermia bacterium]|nr:MAG: S41 family peptidase [Candidatus Acetothermia bacterium]
MNRSRTARALVILIPVLALIIAIGVGGSQDTNNTLFDPVYKVYQYIKGYFYKPELIDDQKALYGAMKGVVEQLNDPYSEFLEPEEKAQFEESLEGEFTGVGIEITIVDDVLTVITPLVGTPAEAAGILAGDQILQIDDESTEGITLSEAAYKIRGKEGTTVILTVRHEDGTVEDIPIVRAKITIESVDSKTLADGKIGYIRILRFESDTVSELDRALASFDFDGLTGMILDLRNDPGGYVPTAVEVAKRFVDDGVIVIMEDRMSGEQKYYSYGNQIPNLPLAVLINRGTASASEIVAGAIRDHNMGILIGEKSFGKGVYQTFINFDDGSALKITAGEYFTPLGRVVNDVGLSPDIEVDEETDPIDVATSWIEAHAGVEMPIDLVAQPTE